MNKKKLKESQEFVDMVSKIVSKKLSSGTTTDEQDHYILFCLATQYLASVMITSPKYAHGVLKAAADMSNKYLDACCDVKN
jgi:hypothetical protein